MRDNNFGELWVDGYVPDSYEYVFASVQTINNRLESINLSPEYFDFIIIDECHHLKANSYRGIINYFKPKDLLGLTATPERMDGGDIQEDFHNRIAAEIRLPEALNRKLLCPFQYFGITDSVDLTNVAWVKGRYVPSELTSIYTANDRRVGEIIEALDKYTKDVQDLRALGFCVSIEHARYMAEKFVLAGLKADYQKVKYCILSIVSFFLKTFSVISRSQIYKVMKMKKYFLLVAIGILAVGCTNSSLSENEVREFVISHLENQVGYEAAVEDYHAGLSPELKVWVNPAWKNKPFNYVINEDNDGSYFYEDSIKVTLYDVYLMGSHANVMGTVQFYISGVDVTYRNFYGIVTKEEGQLKWTRAVGVDHEILAKGLLWPSTTNEASIRDYRAMREAIMNAQFEVAKEISDSLVINDPSWAAAHIGQLQYYYLFDEEKLIETQELVNSKLAGASLAEMHFIKSYTKDREVRNYHYEKALIFAPDDPLLRTWYAFGQEPELAIDILKMAWDRYPSNAAVNTVLGYKYMAVDNLEKAKQHFEISLRVNSDVPNAYDSYGDYCLRVGDSIQAKEMYLKASEMDESWISASAKRKAEKLSIVKE